MTANLALVGCGAISQKFYLPALTNLRSTFDRIWMVDPSEHALSLASSMLPAKTAKQLSTIDDDLQIVIIATPNHLHFPLACEALSRGADVLVEKPFVIWPEEGRQLMKVASDNNRIVAINQTRRFFPLAQALRRKIREGAFGTLLSVVHHEGTRLVWPFESGAGFTREAQRTGVIMDFGVHVIDFYHYLFEPDWKLLSATHDGFGGPEGLADIQLQANGAPVSIRLSRYHQQNNMARLIFDGAEVSFSVYDADKYVVRWKSKRTDHVVCSREDGPEMHGVAERVLLNFLSASCGRERAICDAQSSMPVVDLLDEIYRRAERYPAELGVA